MIFGGLQKTTLLDFPSKVACTVFTYGCNYCCPFCHNAGLVTEKADVLISEEEILSFLSKRVGVLDGVAITGGEPLMQKGIEEFIRKVKAMGYAVKLDTNGSFPEKLQGLIDENLLDYVAMDVKNSLTKYSYTSGVNADVTKIKKSVDILLRGEVDYEFRTTVVKDHHTAKEIEEITELIRGAKRYYLQNFVARTPLIGKAEGVSEEEMKEFLLVAKKIIPSAELRGL